MKINNKKVIVSTLALAMGAALAGSISGSVAWYQYSTRASAQIAGTSAGTEGRLQVKKSTDAVTAFDNHVEFTGATFKPLSAKRATDGTLTFYEHPVYQYAQLATATTGYADFKLNFRFQTNSTNTADAWTDVTNKNIYLSYFEIKPVSGDVDVTSAVRVAFLDSAGKAKFVLGAATAAGTTDTAQNLDMNKNTRDDTTYWDCQDEADKLSGDPAPASLVEYTTGEASYATDAHSSALANVSDPYAIDSATGNSGKILSTTAADNELTVRVWIEGFANIGSTAIWDRDTIAQSFNINMQFQCQADK